MPVDDVEWVPSKKKEWSEKQWADYRKLPWATRRMIDLYSLFPSFRRWMKKKGNRMIAESEARIEKCDRGMEEAKNRDAARRKKRKRHP